MRTTAVEAGWGGDQEDTLTVVGTIDIWYEWVEGVENTVNVWCYESFDFRERDILMVDGDRVSFVVGRFHVYPDFDGNDNHVQAQCQYTEQTYDQLDLVIP